MSEDKTIILPYTNQEAVILPLTLNEITRLYDIVAKKNINFVEDFLRKRIHINSAERLAAVHQIKQFEFEYILLETFKLYSNKITVPSLLDPELMETYYLNKITLHTPEPNKFYIPTVYKDYLIETEINKYVSFYVNEIDKIENNYEKVINSANIQITVMLLKVYNLQKQFENELSVKTDFVVSQDLFKLLSDYDKERPKMLDTLMGTEFKIRPEMFTSLISDLIQSQQNLSNNIIKDKNKNQKNLN